jgi:hypothetical protein
VAAMPSSKSALPGPKRWCPPQASRKPGYNSGSLDGFRGTNQT